MALLDFFDKRKKDPNVEMSFIDHLEELRWHLIRSVIAIVIAAIIVFIYVRPIVDKIIFAPTRSNFISAKWLCALGHKLGTDALCFQQVKAQFLATQMTEQFISSFTVAFV